MTDRELLELAAKAAGIFITCEQFKKECTSEWDPEWEPKYCADRNIIIGWRTWYGPKGEIGGWEEYDWEPLTDDGDALRLAVRLAIHVGMQSAEAWRNCKEVRSFNDGDDPYEATRRAIVTVAADLGRDMP